MLRNQLIGKDPVAGKDLRQEEKGITEVEMAGWHHRLNGHECANFGRKRRTEEPGVLQSRGSQSLTYSD